MPLDPPDKAQADLTLALSRYAAITSSVIVAALHRGKPISDADVQHILKLLATCAASAPEEAKELFDSLAGTVAGKHYEQP